MQNFGTFLCGLEVNERSDYNFWSVAFFFNKEEKATSFETGSSLYVLSLTGTVYLSHKNAQGLAKFQAFTSHLVSGGSESRVAEGRV